jgi:uncharacterized protein (DUF4415 family)
MARKLIPPTRAETLQINRGIAVDPDNPEWADEDFARARPAHEVLPPPMYEAAVKRYRGQRGPQKRSAKKAVTLRVDPDVLASYKATGSGWQSRMNEALRRALTGGIGESTQAKAISRAKKLDPNKPPLVERVRNTKKGPTR